MADYLGINVRKPLQIKVAITTTGTTSVIATGGAFISRGVQVGDIVLNITDPEYTTVTEVVSETELTVSPAGTFTQASDEICVLSGTETIDIPIQLSIIQKVNSSAFGGLNRINISMLTSDNNTDNVKIYIENGGADSDAARTLLVDSFAESIENAATKGYKPNVISTLPLPNRARYAYLEVTAS